MQFGNKVTISPFSKKKKQKKKISFKLLNHWLYSAAVDMFPPFAKLGRRRKKEEILRSIVREEV